MRDLSDVLRETLPASATPAAMRAAEALRETYRSGAPPLTLAIADDAAAAAYAAYRMPATKAAIGAALAAGPPDLALSDPGPARHLDLGGGTGAAVWAVHERWPGVFSSVVRDASAVALELGADIARRSGDPGLARVTWERTLFDTGLELPDTDLVTAGYLLGELSPDLAGALVTEALRTTWALLVVEPGTPRGYAAILAVRDLVIAAGWRIVAPCPHALNCPLVGDDWCHDSVRLQRSALHRQLKAGERGHEDEKFSYLYAVAPGSPTARATEEAEPGAAADGEARVLRHPLQRKGLVQLQVCRPDGTTGEVIISKRHGELYKRARDTEWGGAIELPHRL